MASSESRHRLATAEFHKTLFVMVCVMRILETPEGLRRYPYRLIRDKQVYANYHAAYLDQPLEPPAGREKREPGLTGADLTALLNDHILQMRWKVNNNMIYNEVLGPLAAAGVLVLHRDKYVPPEDKGDKGPGFNRGWFRLAEGQQFEIEAKLKALTDGLRDTRRFYDVVDQLCIRGELPA